MIKANISVLAVLALLLAGAPRATATLTPVYAGGGTEPDLFPGVVNGGNGTSILDELYGAGNYARIDDGLDQIWFNPNGSARAMARYAGWIQDFGFIKGTAGSDFTALFRVTATGYNPSTTPLGTFPNIDDWYYFDHVYTESFFRFGDDPSEAGLWSSRADDNGAPEGSPPANDHMVTFQITGNSGDRLRENTIGNYVLAWEDQPIGQSDRDYNDLVLEVHGVMPVPEPAYLSLLGLGLFALGLGYRRLRGANRSL